MVSTAVPSAESNAWRWFTAFGTCAALLALPAATAGLRLGPVAISGNHRLEILGPLVLMSIGAVISVTVGRGVLQDRFLAAQLDARFLQDPRSAGWLRHLLSQLIPMVALWLAYTFAGGALGLSANNTRHLTLMALSLTVPWLGQLVCMPLYTGLTSLLTKEQLSERSTLSKALLEQLPAATGAGAVPACIVGAAESAWLRLPLSWTLALIGLLLLHVVFLQLLVVAVLPRRNLLWAAAWIAYATSVAVEPKQIWLPATLAIAVLGVTALREHPGGWRVARPRHLSRALLQGGVTGAVLWSDKIVALLSHPRQFPAGTAFLSLVPALITYNLYFARVSPKVDSLVKQLQAGMQEEVSAAYQGKKRQLVDYVASSLRQLAVIGAGLVALQAAIVWAVSPGQAGLDSLMAIEAWAAAITTVAAYKLAYLGQRWCAIALSAGYVGTALAAVVIAPSLGQAYAAVDVVGGLICLLSVSRAAHAWLHPDYELFWRQAMSW